jgi:hypothetical protein
MDAEIISAAWFNSLADEQKKAVLADGLGNRLLHEGLDYAVPIWWVSTDQQCNLQLRNGSACLVDCGHGIFAVTAAHVFKEYCDAKSAAKETVCQIGNALFDPEARLIDCYLEIDISTFRIDASDAAAIDKPILSVREDNWPPLPPDEGNFAFFAGFPAQSRGMSPTGHYFATTPYRAMMPISRITDHQITCRFDREKMLDLGGVGLPPEGYDIGGVSGGPLLIPTLEQHGIGWRLGGVVTQAATGALFEQIVAVRSDYLLPDGRLARHA